MKIAHFVCVCACCVRIEYVFMYVFNIVCVFYVTSENYFSHSKIAYSEDTITFCTIYQKKKKLNILINLDNFIITV